MVNNNNNEPRTTLEELASLYTMNEIHTRASALGFTGNKDQLVAATKKALGSKTKASVIAFVDSEYGSFVEKPVEQKDSVQVRKSEQLKALDTAFELGVISKTEYDLKKLEIVGDTVDLMREIKNCPLADAIETFEQGSYKVIANNLHTNKGRRSSASRYIVFHVRGTDRYMALTPQIDMEKGVMVFKANNLCDPRELHNKLSEAILPRELEALDNKVHEVGGHCKMG